MLRLLYRKSRVVPAQNLCKVSPYDRLQYGILRKYSTSMKLNDELYLNKG